MMNFSTSTIYHTCVFLSEAVDFLQNNSFLFTFYGKLPKGKKTKHPGKHMFVDENQMLQIMNDKTI